MQIGSLSTTALSQMPSTGTPGDISIAVLSKQLEVSEAMDTQMIQAMELSVNPNIGGNIDVYA